MGRILAGKKTDETEEDVAVEITHNLAGKQNEPRKFPSGAHLLLNERYRTAAEVLTVPYYFMNPILFVCE